MTESECTDDADGWGVGSLFISQRSPTLAECEAAPEVLRDTEV